MSETLLARRKPFHLKPWMELVGMLHSLEGNNQYVELEIDNRLLSFKMGSKEASCILEQLDHTFIGREIALLRTDIPDNPLCLRLIK